MVELVVSDLYDKIANEQTGVRVDPEVFYECKHCPAFQISGSSLRDSDKGRAHAAAHRIAFEALLEPSPVLICPICDFALKTSGTACIFGCMFNDLDLVKHLEQDHVDVLADDVVCDFSDPRYLLTTFQEKQLSRSIPESSDEVADVTDSDVDDGTTVDLSNDDNDAELNPCNNGESSHMFLSNGGSAMDEVNTNVSSESTRDRPVSRSSVTGDKQMEERAHVEGESEDGISVIHWNQVVSDTNSNRTSNQKKRCEKLLLRRKMSGVSVVTCMVCQWSPPRVRDSMRIRDEVSKHVRFHLREESKKLPSKSSSFLADQRMLSCMDFSLEEYFEKEHLSDLSGTINSQIMERVYGELLAKLFGICIPLVYRILHGNNGNPFRRPDASRKKRKVIRFTRSKGRRENLKAIPLGKAGHISDRDLSIRFEAKESSDAGSCEQDCADLLVAGNFESDQHIQCARAECGHSLLALADRMAIVRHVAAHIRHDETRLLNRTGASSVVACDCGMAVGSAMGYIYHIVHDHVFEQKQFSDISATIVSYIMLIVETAIASVLSLRVDFRATKWPLWCAYFSLENDEGDENFFAGCTDLNERWLKLWEDFIEEHLTGKSMSPGDTIKLFEMHPFVDEQRLQSRKHKSVVIMDSKSLYRSLSMVWRRLDNWAYDPVHRAQLASESRWIRLAQIRRKVFLESNKDEYQNPDIWSGVTTGANFRNRRLGIQAPPHLSGLSSAVQDDVNDAYDVDHELSSTSLENSSLSIVSPVVHPVSTNAECPNSSSGLVVIPSSANESDYQETTGVAELSGAVVRCSSCSNVCISAVDTAAIKNHCALHAAMEGRMLCSLYIHSAADRPLVCPFCHCEVNVYKPMKFLHHLQAKHMDKARIIYDRYLFHYFPQQKIFGDHCSTPSKAKDTSVSNSEFLVSCQRSSSCGVNPVLVLPHDKTIASSDVDIAIVKHILWHVRNDSFLELELAERELLTRALMIRLTSSHTRQVSVMAKKIAKQFNRDKEQEVVKYLKEKMDEIGWILFGTNKGFVYQMVFARRFVRDQCGMQIYPPCVCRICVDQELPHFSNDRRKRAFVEDAVPVVLHILEHLGAGELSEKIKSAADSMRWKNACKIDGLLFKSPSPAIKHVLDAHIDIVELSALDMVLEDNGLLEIFRDALSVVFADQAWQLEEALGFKGYEMKPCSKANFLNDESNGVNHQPESLHPCDPRDPPASCACADSVSSQSEALGASADSSQYLRSRIKTVCHGMPEASAVCYEEFLHESEVHNDEEDSSCVGIAEDGSMVDAMTSKSSLILPSSTVCVNSTVPPAVPLVSIKVEESEERDDLNNLSGEVQNSSSSPTNFLSNSDPLLRRRKAEQRRKKNISRRIGQKRSVEVKHEPEESVPTASNTALPVKSAIEGSKTAAAALAATLRTGSGYTDTYGQPRNPIGRTQDNSMSDSSDAEDSDLALGNISKRPRLLVPSSHSKSVSSDTPEKK